MIEYRVLHEPEEDPPEGWIHSFNDADRETGELWALYLSSPTYSVDRQTKWIRLRETTQTREVTEWIDA